MLLGHDKISFLTLPTPLEHLPRMSEKLGINLYIKRDDLSGIGMGGNKLRKLQYLLKDALDQGATALLTMGGAQTNHGRLTAAVAAKYGLKCTILSIDQYPGEISANILLDRLMGAQVVLKENDGRPVSEQYRELAAQVTAEYEAQGDKVYQIPIGGSNELGMLGYYECARELTAQAEAMSLGKARVISTIGSMGTYMGLTCGLKNEPSNLSLTGVTILPYVDVYASLLAYYQRIKSFFGLTLELTAADFQVETGYLREGYNQPNREVRAAICEMARQEAIILDPCYTGKTFAAVTEMVAAGKIPPGETVIFLHTGGQPGISTPFHRTAFEAELMDGVRIIK